MLVNIFNYTVSVIFPSLWKLEWEELHISKAEKLFLVQNRHEQLTDLLNNYKISFKIPLCTMVSNGGMIPIDNIVNSNLWEKIYGFLIDEQHFQWYRSEIRWLKHA